MRASDRAYDAIRDDIVAWRLRPGTALAETELAGSLGISRTPVREALSRLAADGLVRANGRFDVVTELSVDNLTELFDYREALETKAAQLAARHHDVAVFAELAARFKDADRLLRGSDREHEEYYALVSRFDAAVDAAIDNSYLLAALRGVRTHLARARRLSKDNPARLLQAAAEHLAIVQAIVDSDEVMAISTTSVHLRASLRNVLATVSVQPEPAQPEPAQPEPAQPEPAQPEPAQPEAPPAELAADNLDGAIRRPVTKGQQ